MINAEWIDMTVASVDIVLCRWGYMLMADPSAALVETRRVLSAGGRMAFAVWDALSKSMGVAAGRRADRARADRSRRPGAPGPFALAAPAAFAS